MGRSLWWSVTAVLTTVGVAVAFVLLGVPAALVIVALGTAGTTLLRYQLPQTATPAWRRTWPPVLDLVGGWAVLAVAGLAAEFAALGIALTAVVITVRAMPLRRKSRAAGSHTGESGEVLPEVPPAELIPCDPLPQLSAVPGLTTAQLCWAWRLSYAGVHRTDCPEYQLEHLAALRSACLDELERRDPIAFQRWLPTARAAGDPARFFGPC